MLAHRFLHDGALHGPSVSLAQAPEWRQRVLARVQRGLCRMRGHDLLLHVEPGRMSLRCVDCGWESTGWAIEGSRVRSADRAG